MASEETAFDCQLLFTQYGRAGETGRICDVDSVVGVTRARIADEIRSALLREMQIVWSPDLTNFELERSPRRMILTVTIERKAVKLYGK